MPPSASNLQGSLLPLTSGVAKSPQRVDLLYVGRCVPVPALDLASFRDGLLRFAGLAALKRTMTSLPFNELLRDLAMKSHE
jgi:hypothetical protein